MLYRRRDMKSILTTVVLLSSSICTSPVSSEGAEPPITDIVFSVDGSSVVACSQAGLQVFDWPALTKRNLITVDADNLHALRFSADGTQLAIAAGRPSEQGIALVLSWPQAKVVARFVHESDSFMSVDWINKNQLVLGCFDRTVIHWDLSEDRVIRSLAGHSKAVTSVCVIGGSSTLVTAGLDQSLRVWNVDTGQLIRSLNQHTQPVRHIAIKPYSSGLPMMASASADRTVRFWQPTIGRMVRYIRLDAEPLKLAWINDSDLACACSDGTVRIIDTANVKVAKQIDVLEGWIYAVAVHPNGQGLVVAGEAGQIRRVSSDTL